jgi:DNA-binding beta-propeller fold protein YncE
MKIKKIITKITLGFILLSCSQFSPQAVKYENYNHAYLSHENGVDLLDTISYRVTNILNEHINSGNVGIVNFGKTILINNKHSNRLDAYNVGPLGFNKIGEIKIGEPIIDIVYKNNEAYIISEKNIRFIKAITNEVPVISNTVPFNQTKLEKAVLSKTSNEIYVYNSANQEFIVIDTEQRKQTESFKINQNISIGGLDTDNDQRLLFTDKSKSDVYFFDLKKKQLIKKIEIPGSDGQFSNPTDLKVFKDKKIYVANNNKNAVSVIDYKSLNIINEIKNTREKFRPFKLSFIEFFAKKINLLITCTDCGGFDGMGFVDLETDKYISISSTGENAYREYKEVTSSANF